MKIIGIILVIFSSSYTGFYFAKRDLLYIEQLNEIKKAFIILKGEVEFANTSLPEAFCSISTRVKKPVQEIFLTIIAQIELKGTKSIFEIWTNSFVENNVNCYFDEEDLQWFSSFGKTLGFLDRNMQVNSIDLNLKYLDGKIKIIQDKHLVNGKMYRSLGILFGVLVSILFI